MKITGKTKVHNNFKNERWKIFMMYEDAIKNIKDNKIIGRSNWDGKFIKRSNNEFEVITQKQPESISEQWLPSNEDILADDWKLIDPDDIKKFHLSVNQLKNLGVCQETIDELEKPDLLQTSAERTKKIQDIVDKLFYGKKSSLIGKIYIPHLSITDNMPKIKPVEIPESLRR